MGLSASQATVLLEPSTHAGGEVSAARWREHQGWRLDKGANRTSFKRQLDAVIALVTTPPSRPAPRIFALITAGEIAPLAVWAGRERNGFELKSRTRGELPA